MRVLLQRVSEANVTINGQSDGAINSGILVFLGIETADNQDDVKWLIQKICGLRIFNDTEGKMNLNYKDVNGEFLVISQFTLHGSTKKGNRPSFIKAAHPETAIPLYEFFIEELKLQSDAKVSTGTFGADMKVALVNDGPVTIWIDSKARE